jgi:hypothetical protein
MKVTRITVNTGNLPRQIGFTNARLDTTLGVQDKGTGQRFAYAFQIAFDLEGISGDDVKVTRRVNHKNEYKFANNPTAQQVIARYGQCALRDANPGLTEDSPNPGNIVRLPNQVIVQDGPGPSMGIADPKMYPMRFEGKFIIMVKSPADELLASVEYYVRLLKETCRRHATQQ